MGVREKVRSEMSDCNGRHECEHQVELMMSGGKRDDEGQGRVERSLLL